jgi:hypothetical protein
MVRLQIEIKCAIEAEPVDRPNSDEHTIVDPTVIPLIGVDARTGKGDCSDRTSDNEPSLGTAPRV